MIARRLYLFLWALAYGLSPAAVSSTAAQDMSMDAPRSDGMRMMENVDVSSIPRFPPVMGYVEGSRIFFVHTEVSDPEISLVLTQMMGSPVPVVPTLASVPDSLLASLWAFTNGVKPEGPRGPLDFQPDVFDNPVGSQGYSPLRMLHLVTWNDDAEPRLLTSAADVAAALSSNEVSVETTGVVANMPFLTWPGGQR